MQHSGPAGWWVKDFTLYKHEPLGSRVGAVQFEGAHVALRPLRVAVMKGLGLRLGRLESPQLNNCVSLRMSPARLPGFGASAWSM